MEHAVDPVKRGCFIRQYRRACLLDHPNIESLLDMVEGDDGPVVVAEWVDGRSLLRLIRWRRRCNERWDPQEIATITCSLLKALRYAHHHPTDFDAQGMLHGGIWPGNVLVEVSGNVRLVDFGMAAVWQDAPEPWQDLEALRYLSADHVRHGPSTASDLYSVGALVHELMSGKRFRGDCETEAQMRTAIDRPEPLEPPDRDDIPPALERLRQALLQSIGSPRLSLEQMLELCEGTGNEEGRQRLSELVRTALRVDSTQPDPDAAPPPKDDAPIDLEGIARIRSRSGAAVHLAARGSGSPGRALRLSALPLGQASPRAEPRDTQSVPVPVEREATAARSPMFLQQTAPPRGASTVEAERRRSGNPLSSPSSTDGEEPPSDETGLLTATDESRAEHAFDPDITAEVSGIPQLPEDVLREQQATAAAARASTERPRRLGGPLGWVLLGAVAVGIGLPLVARCGAPCSAATSSGHPDSAGEPVGHPLHRQ